MFGLLPNIYQFFTYGFDSLLGFFSLDLLLFILNLLLFVDFNISLASCYLI